MQTTGIILAGGQSRRMGRDKANIVFNGKTLLHHAVDLLDNFGVDDHIILGRPDAIFGQPDPLPGEGPAANLVAWIKAQTPPFKLVVLPVDMPLLTLEHLQMLDNNPEGGYFEDLYLPLVALVKAPLTGTTPRMKTLLAQMGISPVTAPAKWRKSLTNFNRPSDFKSH